jgi:uncharacterized protein with PIN domain
MENSCPHCNKPVNPQILKERQETADDRDLNSGDFFLTCPSCYHEIMVIWNYELVFGLLDPNAR